MLKVFHPLIGRLRALKNSSSTKEKKFAQETNTLSPGLVNKRRQKQVERYQHLKEISGTERFSGSINQVLHHHHLGAHLREDKEYLFQNIGNNDNRGNGYNLSLPITDYYYMSSKSLKQSVSELNITTQQLKIKIEEVRNGEVEYDKFDRRISTYDISDIIRNEIVEVEDKFNRYSLIKDESEKKSEMDQLYTKHLERNLEIISFLEKIYSFIYIYLRDLESSKPKSYSDKVVKAMLQVYGKKGETLDFKARYFKYLYDVWNPSREVDKSFKADGFHGYDENIPQDNFQIIQELANQNNTLDIEQVCSITYSLAYNIFNFQKKLVTSGGLPISKIVKEINKS
jgi:hypothetical protein